MPIRTELVRIGNSRGIRIPKALIEQCGLGPTVELTVEKGRLVILPKRSAREGWEEAFATAKHRKRDRMLLEHASNEFDAKEWTW